MGMKLRLMFSVLVLIPLLTLIYRPVSAAQRIYSETTASIVKDQVIEDDVFISAEDVNVQGTINGDLFAAGGNVVVDANVNGNIFVAGGTIKISGEIQGSVMTAGGMVDVTNANISGSILLGAGSVNIDDKSKIGGSVVFGAGMVNIKSVVLRNIVGGAGSVTVNNAIGKDLVLGVGELFLGSSAKVDGDVTYWSDNKANIDTQATITGKIEQVVPPQSVDDQRRGWQRDTDLGYTVWSYLSVLVVGFIAIYLFRPQWNNVSGILEKRPMMSVLAGVIMMLLAIPLIIVVGLTILGIQLVFVAGVIYLLAIYFSKIFFAVVVGRLLTKMLNLNGVSEYLTFALGLLVYYVVQLVPYLGSMVAFLAFIFGTGASILALMQTIKQNRSTSNVPSPSVESGIVN